MKFSPLATGIHDALATGRMHELNGRVLASFASRAAAFSIVFVLPNILFILWPWRPCGYWCRPV